MSTENNRLGARSYQPQYKELLEAVFKHEAYFRDCFGGEIEALDGAQHNENAFYVKTSDIPVVVRNYDTDPDTAMGSGTANSTRFGERTEIIYQDTPVPYTWDWAYHEGIDRHTVNNNLDARSEEHTSELQSRGHLVCRLLLEKKKKTKNNAKWAEEKRTRLIDNKRTSKLHSMLNTY